MVYDSLCGYAHHLTLLLFHHSLHLYHPSALNTFEQIVYSAIGKQIVVFLDYDGTLSPIMRATLKGISRHFPIAIVTGRCRDKVYNFVKLAELGMDITGPTKSPKASEREFLKLISVLKILSFCFFLVLPFVAFFQGNNNNKAVLFQSTSQFLPMIDEVYKILLEKTKTVPRAKVENNKFFLSLHFRCVDKKSWAALAEKVRLVLNEYPQLRLTQGRKVLEIRPTIKWDKGKALEFLLESLGYKNLNDVFPIYIGDDRTDEDAFRVTNAATPSLLAIGVKELGFLFLELQKKQMLPIPCNAGSRDN
ncbi:putative trehalose-phosphate phosphatase J [Glycine max]|nr:putative trehalose-phosphate phosphatase J [Glycine max]